MVTFNEFCELAQVTDKKEFKEFCAYHMGVDVDECLQGIHEWSLVLADYTFSH